MKHPTPESASSMNRTTPEGASSINRTTPEGASSSLRGPPRAPRRPGVILLEAVAALGILATVMVVIVQTSLWSTRERARNAAHHAALELARNIMETARARSPADLTSAWAAGQKLAKSWSDQLPAGKLKVRVEPEKSMPLAKRVTVDINWGLAPQPRSLQLVSVFSPRLELVSGGAK